MFVNALRHSFLGYHSLSGQETPLTDYNRDWVDNIDSPDGWTPLICSVCKGSFRGWKLKTKCFVCSAPSFPKNKRHSPSVAVRYAGKVYSLPAPNRHHHVLRLIHAEHGKTFPNIQGFLDNRGKFLRRGHALRVALAANHVLDPPSVRGGRLYSEDLW